MPLKTSSIALVDTSALLALAVSRDQRHAEAVTIAREFLGRGGRLVGTTLVLGEFHVLVLQRRGPETARTALSRLLADPGYHWMGVNPELVREAVGAWLGRFRDQHFSLADAVSFEVMRREKIAAAFAFDQDFATAGFELLR